MKRKHDFLGALWHPDWENIILRVWKTKKKGLSTELIACKIATPCLFGISYTSRPLALSEWQAPVLCSSSCFPRFVFCPAIIYYWSHFTLILNEEGRNLTDAKVNFREFYTLRSNVLVENLVVTIYKEWKKKREMNYDYYWVLSSKKKLNVSHIHAALSYTVYVFYSFIFLFYSDYFLSLFS